MGQSTSKQVIFNKVREGNVAVMRSMLDGGSDPKCRGEVSFSLSFFMFHVSFYMFWSLTLAFGLLLLFTLSDACFLCLPQKVSCFDENFMFPVFLSKRCLFSLTCYIPNE